MSETISKEERARGYQRCTRELEEACPAFRAFNRRLWKSPGYAASPAGFAQCLMRAAFEIPRDKGGGFVPSAERAVDIADISEALYILERLYGFPFCVVSKSLMDTLMHTDLPESFSTEEMELGLPAMTFLLPFGQLYRTHYKTGDLVEVNVLSILDLSHPSVQQNNLMRFADPTAGRALAFVSQSVSGIGLNLTSCPSSELGALRDYVAAKGSSAPLELGLKLLHFFCTKKDTYLTEETFVKRTKGTGGREVWNARVLGANYNTKFSSAASGEPTGIHQRLHIRRGHYKLQPFGEGRNQRRRILIDPYWAGGKNE